MDFVKKNMVKILLSMLIVSMVLSILFNEIKCPISNVCYFTDSFFMYKMGMAKWAFIAFKLLILAFAMGTVVILNREIKKDSGCIPYMVAMIFFTTVLSLFMVNSTIETISVFLIFMFLLSLKKFLYSPRLLSAFVFALSNSLLIITDIKNLVLPISALLVLFLIDDILKIINIIKILKIKVILGFVLGLLPLLVLFKYDFVAEISKISGNFVVTPNDYVLKSLLIIPILSFNGMKIISMFLPTFFILSGAYALIKAEFANINTKNNENSLSTIDDLIYYIAIYFPIIYVVICSVLLKQRVPNSFFYPIIVPLPFLLKKGIGDAIIFFDSTEEKGFIKKANMVLFFMLLFTGAFAGTSSLQNMAKIKGTIDLAKFIENNAGKYATNRYDALLNYVLGGGNVYHLDFKIGAKNIVDDMLPKYDYYITNRVLKDKECYVAVEPDLGLILSKNLFLKSWICSKPVFDNSNGLYIFEIKNIKQLTK